jgi:hypothetical protein
MQDEIITLARRAHSLQNLSYDEAVERVIGDRKELFDDVWEVLMDFAADDQFAEPDYGDD